MSQSKEFFYCFDCCLSHFQAKASSTSHLKCKELVLFFDINDSKRRVGFWIIGVTKDAI